MHSLDPGTSRPTIANSAVPVLIVDDNPAKRLALSSVLAPVGYRIVEADSGRAALRCVMADDFAVILLDVCMPIMDGYETAAFIRQRRQSEMTPIIFITAFASDELGSRDRYAEGAVDFMSAPVAPDELRAKVAVFANILLRAEELARQARDLQTSADQLRLLTEAAPIGIFHTDAARNYLYTNPRWTEITGVPAGTALQGKWDSGEQPEPAGHPAGQSVEDTAVPVERSFRYHVPVPDSAPRVVLVTAKPICTPDDGEITGWVGTLADVTAEAGAEAAMVDARDRATEASRLKSDFLANMSHEIRTPMNGVLGMTDLLLETDLDSRQRDYAQTVRNSGEALLTIINDILDFSRVEAGKLAIEEVDFDLPAIVDDVVNLLAGPAQRKGLEFAVMIGNSVPALVTGDPGRVRQVLTNLIGNAIKFTSTGEVVVRVTRADASGADSVIGFEVSDTGDGIAADMLAVIFQPFVQADTSTSRRYGGTGLGLAISSQLVALMGGDCGVSSVPGKGSTFWFTIHVREGERVRADSRAQSADPLAGLSALIVDDNATQRGILAEYLTDWGMVVNTAESAPAALATLRTAANAGRPVAVAVVDRTMPGMDGWALAEALVRDPASAVRMVMLTDQGQDREDGDGAALGIGATLSKPVHREQLRACLRRALGLELAEIGGSPAVVPSPSEPADQHHEFRLLLAEDNLINQKVAVAMLAGAGYRVDTVPNGAAAVRAVAGTHYDAVLMDCQMPELNGYQATAAIRAHQGSGRHIPIIAMTAGARQEDRDRCLAEGMDSYISKPVSKDALLALVARSVRSDSLSNAGR